MKITHGKVLGPMRVHEDTRFHGMIDGDVTVVPGVSFDMRGMIAGNLTIEPDASVVLRGMVAGSAINRGQLKLYGHVRGPIRDEGSGQTTYEPDA
jgi:hypothetical protein